MLNLPVFVTASLGTAPTQYDVVECFFRIAAPKGLTRLGGGHVSQTGDFLKV